jgi:predicted house-cleaning NTP pyrophosphatase (Maf/HAM1 superfamily)
MTARCDPDSIANTLRRTPSEGVQKYLSELAGLDRYGFQADEAPRIVLGSHSPRRRLILGELLRIRHQCFEVDTEEHIPSTNHPPDIISKCLALQKLIACMKDTERVAAKGNILLVSDTIVVGKNGEIIGKEPEYLKTDQEKFEYCRARVMGFTGRQTVVFSSIAVADFRTKKAYLGCDSVVIHFRERDHEVEQTVDAYCAHVFDRKRVEGHRGPIGKAGSFGIQEPEILYLAERIEGDITAAIGLPARVTLRLLNRVPGISLPDSYEAQRCVDVVFRRAFSERDLPFQVDLRAHALSLISS